MERRIRVVHILPDLGSGGAEQQVLVMVRGLDPDLFEPIVVCTHDFGALEPAFRETGCKLLRIGKRSRYDLRMLPRLTRELQRLQPDIIHTSMFSSNFWGRIAALFLRPRPIIVVSEHNIDIWKNAFHLTMDRLFIRITDAVYGVSTPVSKFYTDVVGLPRSLVTTQWCGIDLSRAQAHLDWSDARRKQHRQELGIPEEAFVVGWVARPSWEKRLDVLAKVIGRLVSLEMPLRVLMVGRDPETEEQKRSFRQFLADIDRHGARDIVLRRGFVADVSAEYAVMDVLLQTSDWEGLPNVVIEAGAMEVPAVATNAGGTGDIIDHGKSGWLVPTGDVEGLVEGLVHVRAHPDEARAWGREARNRAEELFSQDALIENMTSLYARLLRKNGHALSERLHRG